MSHTPVSRSTTTAALSGGALPTRQAARRVVSASLIGTTIEYYDFAIYGLAAALVFPALFFPGDNAFVSSLSAFATFAVGFIARPLGGVLFGHFGDKYGRKPILVITLVMMGLVSAAIGVLPSYETIGVAAPTLLILCRILQGIAFGGEWGGAVLMAFEYATPGRRNLFAAIPQLGPITGALLGNAVFALVTLLPDDQVQAWGWRIPFLLSLVLVAVGLYLRTRVEESPEFQMTQKAGRAERIPLKRVLGRDLKATVLVALSYLGYGAFASVVVTFMLAYGTKHAGLPSSTLLGWAMIASVCQLPVMLLSAHLADRFGRRVIMIIGPVLAIIGIFVFFQGLDLGTPGGLLLAFVFGQAVCYGAAAGAQPGLFADAFDPEVRFTGMSLGYQVGNVLGTGFTPLIATAILQRTGTGVAIALYVGALLLLSLVALNVLVTLAKRRADATGIAPPAQSLAQ